MATITAKASSDWNNVNTWNGGAVPGSADTADLNGFNVTYTGGNPIVCQQIQASTAAGWLTVTGGTVGSPLTITANLLSSYNGANNVHGMLTLGSSGTNLIIYGQVTLASTVTNISGRAIMLTQGALTIDLTNNGVTYPTGATYCFSYAGSGASTTVIGMITASSTLNIKGPTNLTTTGRGVAAVGIAGITVNVTSGNHTGGSAGAAYFVYGTSASPATINYTGTFTTNGAQLISSTSGYCTATVTLTSTGTVTGGSAAGVIAVAGANANLTVNGNITGSSITGGSLISYAGTGAGITGVVNGNVTVGGTGGYGFQTGGTSATLNGNLITSGQAAGIYSSVVSGATTYWKGTALIDVGQECRIAWYVLGLNMSQLQLTVKGKLLIYTTGSGTVTPPTVPIAVYPGGQVACAFGLLPKVLPTIHIHNECPFPQAA